MGLVRDRLADLFERRWVESYTLAAAMVVERRSLVEANRDEELARLRALRW
jgi:hypothetical protein